MFVCMAIDGAALCMCLCMRTDWTAFYHPEDWKLFGIVSLHANDD